jgi:hypothetical protein
MPKPKFEDVKIGQQFIVTKGSNRLVMRVAYDPKDMRTFTKRICKDTIVTLTGKNTTSRDRLVLFDLGGEACSAVWGEFKRHTTPHNKSLPKIKFVVRLWEHWENGSDTYDDIAEFNNPYKALERADETPEGQNQYITVEVEKCTITTSK